MPGHEWDKFEGLTQDPAALEAFLDEVPFNRGGQRRLSAAVLDVPDRLAFTPAAVMSTQQGFGLVLNELARGDSALASRIVTTSPDVTVSTNLGAWVNRRGLFARAEQGGSVPQRKDPLDLQLGVFAEGPAHRARHRRDEPVHPGLGAGPVARHQRRAAAAGR